MGKISDRMASNRARNKYQWALLRKLMKINKHLKKDKKLDSDIGNWATKNNIDSNDVNDCVKLIKFYDSVTGNYDKFSKIIYKKE